MAGYGGDTFPPGSGALQGGSSISRATAPISTITKNVSYKTGGNSNQI